MSDPLAEQFSQPAPPRREATYSALRGDLAGLHRVIAELQSTISSMQAPQVNVDAPDLSEIVQAVAGLANVGQGTVTSEELMAILSEKLSPPETSDEKFQATIELLEKHMKAIDSRLVGIGRSFGGAGPTTTTLTDKADRALGEVHVRDSGGTVINPATKEDVDGIEGTLATLTKPSDNQRVDIQRPSEKVGRTHVDFSTDGVLSADTDLYTVTPGTTFYLSSLLGSVRNTSLAASGRAQITDDGVVKAEIAISPDSSFRQIVIASLAEPIQFASAVRIVLAGGSIEFTASGLGYEE